jgi:hypothetical protein
MGAFIVPRVTKKQFVPTITLEEISNLLVLYLSTVADYVHYATAIECDPEEKRTTLMLQGQLDPRLDRRICVRATVLGRTAPRLDSKIWADPFVVALVSEDLGLSLDLAIEPHADRTIVVSKEKGARIERAAPAQADDVAPADESRVAADEPAAGPADAAVAAEQESAATDAEAEPDCNTGEPELQSASESADNGPAVEPESAGTDADRAAVETQADAGEPVSEATGESESEIAAEASTRLMRRDFESLTSGDVAGEAGTETAAAAEAAFDTGAAVVEAPAELTYANLDAAPENVLSELAPEAAVEALASGAPIVGEAPVEVAFAGLEPLEDGEANPADVGMGTEANAGTLTVPEPVAETETIAIEASNTTEIATAAHAEPAATAEAVAAEEPAPVEAEAVIQAPAAAVFEGDASGGELERAEKPITIAEVFEDHEELIVALGADGPGAPSDESTVAGDGFVMIEETAGSAATTGANDGAGDPPTETAVNDGEAITAGAQDPDLAEMETVVESKQAEDDPGPVAEARNDVGQEEPMTAADPDAEERVEPVADEVVEEAGEKSLPSLESYEDDDEADFNENDRHGLISDDSIAAMTEQAVFGPGQRKRCAIVKGNNAFTFPIVGESHYQSELEQIAIAHAHARRRGRFLIPALLVPEPNNFFDKYAVAVQINRRTVGYLTFEAGPMLLKALADGGFDCAACAAAISGGEDLNDGTIAAFSVKLDVTEPLVLGETAQSGTRQPSAVSTARAA